MNYRKIIKITACTAAAAISFFSFGINAFSIVDYSAGESGLLNNNDMKYTVNIVSNGKTAAAVPIGIGLRGDANSNGIVDFLDLVKASRCLIHQNEEGYENTLGYAMADTDGNGIVDFLDLVRIAKYLMLNGTHEEKWAQIFGK